jgi:TonB family protein
MNANYNLSGMPRLEPAPRLLVELPSWRRNFVDNLRDLISPRPLPRLELQSAPAPFWPDVFVKRELPWRRFLDSGVCHLLAWAVLIGISRLLALQPRAELNPDLDRSPVIYYKASEYLPPLDTRSARSARSREADPEYSKQPIISVPAEADNRSQTVVVAPQVKLQREVALPNIVAWSDEAQKPRLAIPDAPLTLAAELNRMAPRLERSVVSPPPDAARLTPGRETAARQSSVVAPPPSVETAANRPIGDLNIGRSAVIAPAPQLALNEQRTMAGSRASASGRIATQVVAPPPSLPAASGSSFGARGRVIALNLHPAVSAPSVSPAGNRRGALAARPEGRPGASGDPGAEVEGGNARNSTKSGSAGKAGDLPAGLYVGNAGAKTSPAAGGSAAHSAGADSGNSNLAASVRPPRVTSAPSRTQPESTSNKLSEAERAVFGDRKIYSMTLNMPNLNSAGGSWVIRFAELNHGDSPRDARGRDSSGVESGQGANAPAGNLSQPAATRKVDPAYPMELMHENVAGTVILYAVIHADGSVGSVRVLRGVDNRLDQYASAAVAQWKFQPATKDGAPVDVEATFQIPFRPSHAGTSF